jgi:hypothetical protein
MLVVSVRMKSGRVPSRWKPLLYFVSSSPRSLTGRVGPGRPHPPAHTVLRVRTVADPLNARTRDTAGEEDCHG